MRPFFFAGAAIAALSVAVVLPACNSSSSTSTNNTDAGIPPGQVVGQPCDPTLTEPCAPGPACFKVTCDPVRLVCVETQPNGPCVPNSGDAAAIYATDSGADGGNVSGGCTWDAQCTKGERCAFPVTDACSAVGMCILPDVPTNDAGEAKTACGCNGQSVDYVTATTTAAPVSSAAPCPDASVAVDAAPDAPADAGGTDATTD